MNPQHMVGGGDNFGISADNPAAVNDIALKLRWDYQAFTYFDTSLKKELEAIIQNLQSGKRNPDAVIAFQTRIHETQTRLNLGYDSLFFYTARFF